MFLYNHSGKKSIDESIVYNNQTHDDDTQIPKSIRRMQKFKNCCKTFTSFFFSRIGLVFLVVGYVIIGGFIFQRLEMNESINNEYYSITGKTNELVNRIWSQCKQELVIHGNNLTNKIRLQVINYQLELIKAVENGYINGADTDGNGQIDTTKWTFPNSMLYAVTIITTIGYGHLTCKTIAGKIFTLIYATIGVPLNFLCLANIGSSMANTFRFIYAKICCGYCNYVRRRQIHLKTLAQLNNHTNLRNASLANNNNNVDGISSTSFIDIIDDKSIMNNDYKKITVPISMTLFLLSSYIILGAWLFSVWEGWSYLDGAYFCFITLSTIGLGDLVPGNSIKDTQTEEKLVLVSFYLLMGLSLIAMCFNLMQEEVTAKFRRLAIRLGIIEDPDYW